MYRTSASRILVSAFFDTGISDADLQEKQALKDAKKFCDNCSTINENAIPNISIIDNNIVD